YPRHACLHDVFAQPVARTPDAVAVDAGGRQLSYRELDRRADGVAEHLRSLGVAAQTLVGVSVERSPEMVVSLLGILKAGGAYVPLDPDYPRERLAFMLQDAGISVLLTEKAQVERLPDHDLRIVHLETIRAHSEHPIRRSRPDPLSPQSLAYVMFTSGSTGRPKGVSVTHRGVLRLVRGNDYARLTADEVFLQLAPVAFDASTLEIWGALLNGGRLVVAAAQKPSLEDLGRTLSRHRVTTLWLTAGLFHLMVDERLADLGPVRQLLAGGDVLSPGHVRRVLDQRSEGTLINGYGPTECTTFTCCHPMHRGTSCGAAATVPIGRSIANTRVYLVDA
ncbi:MAG: AMP-binding protein, partial [bacterium]|nr:AMP-binding protein [bacterium]